MPIPFATPLGRAILSGAPRPAPPPIGPVFQPPVVTLTQSPSYTGNVTFTTNAVTVAANVGDLVIACWHGSGIINSIADSVAGTTNTWTAGPPLNVGGRMTNVWSRITTALPVGTTFNINAATTGSGKLIVIIIPASVSPGVDQTGGTLATTTAGATISFTPTNASECAVMVHWTDGGGDTLNLPSGWTQLARIDAGGANTRFDALFVRYKQVTSTATDSSYVFTQSSSATAIEAITVRA